MRCAMPKFFVHGLLLVTSWIQIHFEERRREGKNSRKIYGKKWKRGKIEQTMVAPQLLCYSRPPFKTRQQRILVGAEKEEALNKRKRHCIFFYIETTDVCKGQFIDWYSPWCVIRNCETNKAVPCFEIESTLLSWSSILSKTFQWGHTDPCTELLARVPKYIRLFDLITLCSYNNRTAITWLY